MLRNEICEVPLGLLATEGSYIKWLSFHFTSFLSPVQTFWTPMNCEVEIVTPAKLKVKTQFQRGSQDTVATHYQYGHL